MPWKKGTDYTKFNPADHVLYFPDENHWVLKPQNSVQWYGEVLGWLGKWTAK